MMQFLKRKEKSHEKAKEIAGQSPGEVDPVFGKKYPALSEFIAAEEWEPGVPRERGTITIFYEDAMFKASLNDRDSEQSAYVSKKGFHAVLEALEKGLVSDSLDWRRWRQQGKGKGKRS